MGFKTKDIYPLTSNLFKTLTLFLHVQAKILKIQGFQ